MKYRTLIVGIVSPLLAAVLGGGVYRVLTRASENRDADFVFRLSMTALAMALPFLVCVALAVADRKKPWGLSAASKAGLVVATLSLGLLWFPVNGLVQRARQAEYLALDGIPAPEMTTVDLNGRTHRLSDYRGKVVLLNIWATWCPPCRKEMPELDRLYTEKAPEGLVVLGLSFEEPSVQKEFLQKIAVSYPLLTGEGTIPEVFSTTARYPANFLIDREGNLRHAPSTDEPFQHLVDAVERLLQPGKAEG